VADFLNPRDAATSQLPPRNWLDHLCTGVVFYYLTSLVAVFGVMFGHDYVWPTTLGQSRRGDLLDAFNNWDGEWFNRIANEGYQYDPDQMSSVAFFPAFPLLGRWLADLTGWPTAVALLATAHLALAGAFVVLAAYWYERVAHDRPQAPQWALLAFGLWPMTFFFRMGYSESLFLLFAVTVLYGLQRRWPLALVAVVAGAATATRPVGVALLPALALALWQQSPSMGGRTWRLCWLLPLGCWGLLAYMVFQAAVFGDPLAFAHTQTHWRVRAAVAAEQKAWALTTLEPLWSPFHPSSPCGWQTREGQPDPTFSPHLANPIYFVAAGVLVLVGGWRRWLNAAELWLAAGLLLIPYVTRSYEMCSSSMGRFAALAFPIYLVLGHGLTRIPPAVAAALLALSAVVMGIYAALFGSWYSFY
jgi:hypothetical protein